MFHLIMKRLSLRTVSLFSSLKMLEVLLVTNSFDFFHKNLAVAKQLVFNTMKVDFKALPQI